MPKSKWSAWRWWSSALGSLVVGTLVALLIRYAAAEAGPSLHEKTVPLQTHANMLLVRSKFYVESLPTVEEIAYLEEGRVTLVAIEGDYAIELLDRQGQVLYRQSFDVEFVRMTDPPKELDQVERSFVLPFTAEVVKVRLVAPQGSVEVALP